MKRSLLVAIAAITFGLICVPLSTTMQASPQVVATPSSGRVLIYQGQNPDTNENNLIGRYTRLVQGAFLRDILGSLGAGGGPGGAWSNLNITPVGGLFVGLEQATSNQPGVLYQFGPDDANAVPLYPGSLSGESLPADSTQLMLPALLLAQSPNIGPLPAAGTSGDAIDYMIEGQVITQDANQQSVMFVNSAGISTFNNVNTQREDAIQIQFKAGTQGTANCTSSYPTPPTVDSGWIQLGIVCVPHGTTSITSGMVTMDTDNQFINGSFGIVHFGGAYAQSGATPSSTLSTSNNVNVCGLNNGLGLAINNSAGTVGAPVGHIIRADLNGDLAVCGTFLYINAGVSGSTNAAIYVNTTIDDASQTQLVLYPATGSQTAVTTGSCTAGSYCTLSSGEFFCGFGGAGIPTAASVSGDNGTEVNDGLIMQTFDVSAGGFGVAFYNGGSGPVATGTHLLYHYSCL